MTTLTTEKTPCRICESPASRRNPALNGGGVMTTLFRSHADEVIHILSRCTEAEPCRVCAPIDAPESPVRLTECGSERHLALATPDDQREPRMTYVCDCHGARHEVEIA